MKKTIIIGIMVLIGLFTITGCFNKNNNYKEYKTKIVGKWKNEDFGYDFIYVFKKDGKGSYDMNGSKAKFTYTLDKDKISILYDGETIPFETTISIKDDILNVKDSNGNDTLYKRIK